MKRLISCLLILCMLFALGACSGKKDPDPTPHTHEHMEDISTTLESDTDVFNDATEATEESTNQTNSTSGNKVTTTTADKSHKHTWTAATCAAAKTCTICKKTEGTSVRKSLQFLC